MLKRISQITTAKPFTILAIYITITIAALTQIPKLEVRTAIRDFLPPEAESIAHYDAFLQDFGGNPTILVALEAPSVFTPEVLTTLQNLHQSIETAVDVVAIESLASTLVRPPNSTHLSPLSTFFSNPAQTQKQVLERPHLINHLVSDDNKITAILITPKNLTGWQNRLSTPQAGRITFTSHTLAEESVYLHQVVERIKALAQQYETENVRTSVIGSAVINERLKSDLSKSMMRLLLTTLGVITLLLVVLLRRIQPVLLAIWVVISATIWSLGCMGALGIPLSATFQLLPAFLLVIGIGYSVHLLTVVGHVALPDIVPTTGRAIFAAGITTVLGLLSFGTAVVIPVAQLGIVSGLGVFFILVLTLVFLPALLAIKTPPQASSNTLHKARTSVEAIANISAKFPKRALGLSAVVVLFLAVSIPHLETRYEPLEWLPKDLPLRQDIDRLNTSLNGFILEIVVNVNDIHAPNALSELRRLHNHLTTFEIDGVQTIAVRSVINALDEMGENDFDSYQKLATWAPQWKSRYVDRSEKKFRYSIKIPWVPYLQISAYANAVQKTATQMMPGQAIVTGKPVLLSRAANSLLDSMISGYGLAALSITIVLAWWLRNPILICIGIITNSLPVIMVLGICGWLSFYIDIYLLLVGTIVVSLAVDDTLHFLVGLDQQKTPDIHAAITNQLSHVGPGIITTTLVICFGFGVFISSEYANLATFGFVVALGALFALLADIIVAPALLSLFWRKISKT